MCGLIHIEEVTVDIVLENKAGWVEPVIEDLATHYVSTNTPAVLVALMTKPIVTEHLSVEIVGFEGRVVDVHLGSLKEEEAVMVNKVVSAVESEKDGLVDTLIVVDKLGICVNLPSDIQHTLESRTSLGKKLKYLV